MNLSEFMWDKIGIIYNISGYNLCGLEAILIAPPPIQLPLNNLQLRNHYIHNTTTRHSQHIYTQALYHSQHLRLSTTLQSPQQSHLSPLSSTLTTSVTHQLNNYTVTSTQPPPQYYHHLRHYHHLSHAPTPQSHLHYNITISATHHPPPPHSHLHNTSSTSATITNSTATFTQSPTQYYHYLLHSHLHNTSSTSPHTTCANHPSTTLTTSTTSVQLYSHLPYPTPSLTANQCH